MTLTPTVGPTVTPTAPQGPVEPAAGGETVRIRYSWYWPPLGGVNTSMPHAPHLARTASGERWQDWVGRGIACPPGWAFGTQIRAFGQVWTCVDRGSKIVWPWVDFLTPEAHVEYGTWIDVELVRK